MSTFAIETERLTKQFVTPRSLGQILRHPREPRQAAAERRVTAVQDVSLQVGRGELFGLLGPNGAGKTTLIKLLCTLIVPSQGQARIAGHDLKDAGAVRQAVGMASGDERSFYWRLTGRQNLEFFATLYNLDRDTAQRQVANLLAQVNLEAEADRPFRNYSSGQKQRLSIARALLHQPQVLFLDEPTRSLDPTATMNLHEFIERELLGRLGMTIFLTTHRLDEAQRLCHRVGIMHKGKLRACGTVDELRASLGPVIVYRLQVGGLTEKPAALTAGLAGRIVAQPTGYGDWLLRLEAQDPETTLAALIDRITSAGGQVKAVDSERPPLEQVFERFTQT